MSSACYGCGISGCGPADREFVRDDTVTTVALAGNPNVGKTTIFNSLTGLRQHTGNWPGKTVLRAEGAYEHADRRYQVIDLPGTYSLSSRSAEEEVARDFICFGRPDVTVVVVDATALERNLNLVLQTSEITPYVIVCVNLLDEAQRKGITVDLEKLSAELGLPTVGTVARTHRGIVDLKDLIDRVAGRQLVPQPRPVRYPDAIEKAVAELIPEIAPDLDSSIPARWVALRMLEGDDLLPGLLKSRREGISGERVMPSVAS